MHRDRLQHIADLQLRHRPLRRDHAVLLRQAADAQLGILREPGVALKEIRRLIQLRVGRKRLAPAVHDHIVLVYAHNGHDQPRRNVFQRRAALFIHHIVAEHIRARANFIRLPRLRHIFARGRRAAADLQLAPADLLRRLAVLRQQLALARTGQRRVVNAAVQAAERVKPRQL